MAGKWADFEKNKDFINFQYRTANDERVRASHRILHGTTLSVDDPFWKQYTPPNGWGCRCTVVAVLKDDYPVQDSHGSIAKAESCFKTPKEKMFKENLAEKKRLFPSKHPYLPKGCGECEYKKLIFENEKAICKACRKIDKEYVKWSRETARNHYQKLIGDKEYIEWNINNGDVDKLTIKYQDIKTVTGKPHSYPFARNMAVYYLKTLLQPQNAKYLGNTPDIKGNDVHGHTTETIWHYYEIKFMKGFSYIVIKEVNGKKYIHHIQDEMHFDKSKIRNKTF